jgi:hypothetical protein
MTYVHDHDFDDDGGAAYAAEQGYERYLETRGWDEDSARELADWGNTWFNGYARCQKLVGCLRGVYHPTACAFDEELADELDALDQPPPPPSSGRAWRPLALAVREDW